MSNKTSKALTEAAGLLRAPQRVIPLINKLTSDKLKTVFEPRHLYSYASTRIPTENALRSLINWILDAQNADGGIAAYYSLLTGYSASYPEVTGYIIPTLFDFALTSNDASARDAAYRATEWLLSLQMPSGAFPAGLSRSGVEVRPPSSIPGKFCKAWCEPTRNQKSWKFSKAPLQRAIGYARCSGPMASGPGLAPIKEAHTLTTAWFHCPWRNWPEIQTKRTTPRRRIEISTGC